MTIRRRLLATMTSLCLAVAATVTGAALAIAADPAPSGPSLLDQIGHTQA